MGRRRQRLESEGYIVGYSARLDPSRVGLTVQAFVQVQMVNHAADTAKSFATLIETRPEIISAWTLTGEADYLLRVFCDDLPALNTLIHDIPFNSPHRWAGAKPNCNGPVQVPTRHCQPEVSILDSFLFLATIYLAAAVIAVPFAARLGLGSVLWVFACRYRNRANHGFHWHRVTEIYSILLNSVLS